MTTKKISGVVMDKLAESFFKDMNWKEISSYNVICQIEKDLLEIVLDNGIQEQISVWQMQRTINNSIYLLFGKNTKKWLDSIKCPKCKNKSKIDYGLKSAYKKPCLVCLNCSSIYELKKLDWY